jgi:hypothetical protein
VAMDFVNSLVHQSICFSYQYYHVLTRKRPFPPLLRNVCHCHVLFSRLRTKDHETAASAVRNLNNVDVGGRPLRIDLADSDPFLEGKTTVRGELVDSGDLRPSWRERERERDRDRDDPRGPPRSQDPMGFLSTLPPGVAVPLGSTSLDTISQTLATMNPSQLTEVLAQMKVCHVVPSCRGSVNLE